MENIKSEAYEGQKDIVEEDEYDDGYDYLEDGAEDYGYDEEDAHEQAAHNNTPPYEMIAPMKLKEGETPLSKVVGHDKQKEEILSVISWFKRSKELKAKGVSIPKGIILYGQPGNGKSLMIKEIIRCCDCQVFLFRGKQNNVAESIVEVFAKAKKADHAIIVMDELDLLINGEKRVIRALQECLDGVELDADILVLTATNSLNSIPNALLRNGRLEKHIQIPYPSGNEALELLKKHFKEFGLKLPDDFDDEEVALSLNGVTCAAVKSIVNDLVLRNGFENVTSDMIDDSIYNVTCRARETVDQSNIEVAIHEAGHAVMANAFPEFFKVNRLSLAGADGSFNAKQVERDFWPYDKVIARIKICMAGILAQKTICGRGSLGCEVDLQQARSEAYHLLNMSGGSSCWETLPEIRPGARMDTNCKRRRMERKIERLLKKCEKETTRYIKSHKEQIRSLGELLFEKKHLKATEILSCIG